MAERVGQQFGHYRLVRKLGSGGYADVYLGQHIHIGSFAAIKVLHEQLSDEHKELFRTEARNLAQLIHSNIVRLLDFGFDNNIPYLVMDYAPNGSLREKYPKGTRLPPGTIVTYVKQIAEALQYAHNQKLIHRDVKPENMLLGRNNEVVLSDFGIAVVAHSTNSMRTEDSIGTISYMAPEQLKKKPRPASDQYALAVVVYSWITGILPFTGSQIQVAMQHLTDPIPPMRTLVPTLPVEVERVVLKALEKDPDQRYETIQAFALALVNEITRFEKQSAPSRRVPPAKSAQTVAAPFAASVLPQRLVDLRCPNCRYLCQKSDSYCLNCGTRMALSESGFHMRIVGPPVSTSFNEPTSPDPIKVSSFNEHNVSIEAGSRSDPGIKRKQRPNEDSLLAVVGERTCNRLPQQFGLFVVADGMGGHANGQDASRLAIQTMVDRILPRLSSNEDLDEQTLQQLLVEGVQQANLAVYERNMEYHADMGTTMTSALVVGNMAYVANVGDGRTYIYRELEGLRKITQDHSVVANLVEKGIIRPEDIYTHPKRNQIYRCLGEKLDLEVDLFTEPLQPGDKLLLCSDGLWEMVRDHDIQRIMSIPNTAPKQTVNTLVNAANEGGGDDDISVIMVSVTVATSRTGLTGFHLLEKPETVQMPQL